MPLFYRRNGEPFLAFFFALSSLLVSLAASKAPPTDREVGLLLTGLGLTAVHFAAYWGILASKSDCLRIRLVVFGSVVLLTIIAAGILMDRDIQRSAFHAAAQIFMISLYRKEDAYRDSPSKEITRSLIGVTFALIVAGIVWMLLLGYNLMFRDLPGASDWMLFNFYSVANILVGIDVLTTLRRGLNIQFRLRDGRIDIDGTDYTSLLSPSDLGILRAFALSDRRRITCSAVLDRAEGARSGGEPNREQCRTCLAERQKATLCSDYKRIYNQVNKIKRFLETMKLGTILPPGNKMKITTEGWTLRLFENVRLQVLD